MPYIGNIPKYGDSINHFRQLDNIGTYECAFDGSSALIVSTANDTISVPSHRFIQGHRVTYLNGGGGNIGGLAHGTAYYIIFVDTDTIKLATTSSNASSGNATTITSVGSGTQHTLTAAFDGVNTVSYTHLRAHET